MRNGFGDPQRLQPLRILDIDADVMKTWCGPLIVGPGR